MHRRVFQHKFHHFEGFTDRYDVTRLLYWESYDEVHTASSAARPQLKGVDAGKKKICCFDRSSQSALGRSGGGVVPVDEVAVGQGCFDSAMRIASRSPWLRSA